MSLEAFSIALCIKICWFFIPFPLPGEPRPAQTQRCLKEDEMFLLTFISDIILLLYVNITTANFKRYSIMASAAVDMILLSQKTQCICMIRRYKYQNQFIILMIANHYFFMQTSRKISRFLVYFFLICSNIIYLQNNMKERIYVVQNKADIEITLYVYSLNFTTKRFAKMVSLQILLMVAMVLSIYIAPLTNMLCNIVSYLPY